MKGYCYVLYDCAYCGDLTYLSWTVSASAVNPFEAKIGAIVTRYDNKTGVVIRKNVICFPCFKEMRHKNNSNNEATYD